MSLETWKPAEILAQDTQGFTNEQTLDDDPTSQLGGFFRPARNKYRLRTSEPTSLRPSGIALDTNTSAEASTKAEAFTITVSSMAGESVAIGGLAPSDLVASLRCRVANEFNLDCPDVQLMFGSKILSADRKSLKAVGLRAGDSCMLVRVCWQRLLACVAKTRLRNSIQIWDIGSGQLLQSIESVATAVVFAGDNCIVSWFNSGLGQNDDRGNILHVWHLDSGICANVLKGHEGQVNCAVLQGEQFLLTGSSDATARRWALETGEVARRYIGHAASVTCVDVFDAPAAELVVTGSLDRTVRLWSMHTGEQQRIFQHSGSIMCIHVSGDLLVAGGDVGEVWLRDVRTGRYKAGSMEFEHGVLMHHQGEIHSGHQLQISAVLSAGKQLFTGSNCGKLCFWDVASGRQMQSIQTECLRPVRSLTVCEHLLFVAFGPDEVWMQCHSKSMDEVSLKVYDIISGKEVRCGESSSRFHYGLLDLLKGLQLGTLRDPNVVAVASFKRILPKA